MHIYNYIDWNAEVRRVVPAGKSLMSHDIPGLCSQYCRSTHAEAKFLVPGCGI
jgi:hypothetical protein